MLLKNTQLPHTPVPVWLHGALRDFGFVCGGHAFHKDNLTFARQARWLALSEEAAGPTEQRLSLDLGQPGLWKWVHNGALSHRVFEIPLWVVSDATENDYLDGSGPASFWSLLAWMLETRPGRVPPDWLPPAAELVQGWLRRGALTVQARGYVYQSELVLAQDRWALRVPILPRLAEDLPEPRRRALARLASQAQRYWAMVRLGFTAAAGPVALVAEVDFTGAPHCELLFSAGLDVLRHVVAWLAETAEVLGDPTIEITSLAPGGDNKPST